MSKKERNRLLALAGESGSRQLVYQPELIPEPSEPALMLPEADQGWPSWPARHSVLIDAWQPTPLNTLMHRHHFDAARMKSLDAAMIAANLRVAGVPRANCRRRVTLQIILGSGQRRPPDPDCWWKSLLDGLVRCGALRDDSYRWCERERDQPYIRAEVRATRITLEDIPNIA